MRKFFERNWFMEVTFLILTQKVRLIISQYVYGQKLGKIFFILVNNTFLKTCFNKAEMGSMALNIKIVSTQYHYYNSNLFT